MSERVVKIDRNLHRQHLASALGQSRSLSAQANALLSAAVAVVLEDLGEGPIGGSYKLQLDNQGAVVEIRLPSQD